MCAVAVPQFPAPSRAFTSNRWEANVSPEYDSGLWQALNNSVHLRHAPFLWIENLAAPDMLFRFPFEIPLIGGLLGPYFTVLPVVVGGLMLVQTQLVSPPARWPALVQQAQGG